MWHLMILQIKLFLSRDVRETLSKYTFMSGKDVEEFGMVDESNKCGTISQETRVHVQRETENKH